MNINISIIDIIDDAILDLLNQYGEPTWDDTVLIESYRALALNSKGLFGEQGGSEKVAVSRLIKELVSHRIRALINDGTISIIEMYDFNMKIFYTKLE